ncbi:MAG: type II CAAX endopeptidase family protein [Saprospiraceae bacterium]|nr:type II CAAX endopeptidase family protein [Saprospiraceae bacterium]
MINKGIHPWRVLLEFAILIGLGIALTIPFNLWIYPAWGLPVPGPAPVRTVILVVVATLFLGRLGKRWADFGLRWEGRLTRLVLLALLFLVLKLLLQNGVSWLRDAMDVPPVNYAFFQHIEGNTLALVLWVLVAWVAGGFAEEMLLRGYAMHRIAGVLGGHHKAWMIALVLQAVIFGLAHAYVGFGGVIFGFVSALFYGAIVLVCKKSLWPAILVHGLWDTLGFLVIYTQGIPEG